MMDAPRPSPSEGSEPPAKRACAPVPSHAEVLSWPQEAEVDHLKALYPHARDGDCHMEEATHT